MIKLYDKVNYKSITELKKINRLKINEGQFASDILNNIKELKTGEDAIINLPLGSGKTYWVLNNILGLYAKKDKKILYLVHRKTCLYQMVEDIKRVDERLLETIDLRTMQSLFNNSFRDDESINKLNLNSYDLIVIDESHSLMDSGWTKTNQRIFDEIKNSRAQKFYVSATNEDLILYMVNKENFKQENIYYVRDEYQHINRILLYKEADLYNIIENLSRKKEKSLIIVNDSDIMKELYTMYKSYSRGSMFGVSDGNPIYREVAESYIEDFKWLLVNKEFPENIDLCFSTTFIDAGISIKDEEFKNILIYNVGDINTIKQISGRKRMMHVEDTINLYIDERSQAKLASEVRKLREGINYIEDFKCKLKEGKSKDQAIVEHFLLRDTGSVGRFVDNYIYVESYEITEDKTDVQVRVNEISHSYNISTFYRIFDYKELRWMGIIGREFRGHRIIKIDRSNTQSKLSRTLNSYYIKRVKFYDMKEKRDLAKTINYRIDGKLKTGMKNLNHALEVEKLPYRIVTKKENMKEMRERVDKEKEAYKKGKIGKKDIRDYRRNYWAIVDKGL